MKRADAALLKRYAFVRGLRARLLKTRWAALSADNRRTLRAEMTGILDRHAAEQARQAAGAAFDTTRSNARSGHA